MALDLRTFEDGRLEGPIRLVEKCGWFKGDPVLSWIPVRLAEKLGSLSMSIPLFFAAVTSGGSVFVDGGAVWNFPIEIFDGPGGTDPATLGLHGLFNQTPPPPTPVHDIGRRATDFDVTNQRKLALIDEGVKAMTVYPYQYGGGGSASSVPPRGADRLVHCGRRGRRAATPGATKWVPCDGPISDHPDARRRRPAQGGGKAPPASWRSAVAFLLGGGWSLPAHCQL